MQTNLYSLKLVKDRTVRYSIREAIGPTEAAAIIRTLVADAPAEHMVVVFLDANNKVIGTTIAALGGSHGLQLTPKDLFRAAIIANASAIVLGHNHPSGDPTPSKEDIIITERLKTVGELLGCPIVDHVIVAFDGGSWSMHDKGTVSF